MSTNYSWQADLRTTWFTVLEKACNFTRNRRFLLGHVVALSGWSAEQQCFDNVLPTELDTCQPLRRLRKLELFSLLCRLPNQPQFLVVPSLQLVLVHLVGGVCQTSMWFHNSSIETRPLTSAPKPPYNLMLWITAMLWNVVCFTYHGTAGGQQIPAGPAFAV